MTTPILDDPRTPRHRLGGVLPIVHLPFDAADRVDVADLRREVDWIFSASSAESVGERRLG